VQEADLGYVMVRILPRRSFTRPRRLAVSFFTSSVAKYVQANLLFEASGLSLVHRRNADEPYHENYAGTKEELLTEAIREIRGRGAAMEAALFFIEDTSIRIEGLSQDEDYPGLAAKEWFQRTTFEELDSKLKVIGNRAAIVHSCIALAVPELERPVFFYGETPGNVADRPAQFSPDPLYPWLVPDNFSAWFIPDGSNITLSEMSFEASLNYDFRVRSLTALIDRLEEYAVVLNAVPSMYSRMPALKKDYAGGYLQSELFPDNAKPVFLVIGPTCAGKSTLGNYAQQHIECQVIDASSVVRTIRDERQQDNVPIGKFATALLDSEGPDVVARHIVRDFSSSEPRKTLIVTGFRAIEEVEFFHESYTNATVVSIEAPPRVRYERYIRRGSREAINSFAEFYEHDAQQYAFGLLNVASELADIRVFNYSSREVYYGQISEVLGIEPNDAMGIVRVGHRLNPETSQLYRCLVILRSAGRPLTTQEIEKAFLNDKSVRYNNANKMLKRYPELAHRQEGHGSNVRYQITQSGLAFIAAVDRLNRNVLQTSCTGSAKANALPKLWQNICGVPLCMTVDILNLSSETPKVFTVRLGICNSAGGKAFPRAANAGRDRGPTHVVQSGRPGLAAAQATRTRLSKRKAEDSPAGPPLTWLPSVRRRPRLNPSDLLLVMQYDGKGILMPGGAAPSHRPGRGHSTAQAGLPALAVEQYGHKQRPGSRPSTTPSPSDIIWAAVCRLRMVHELWGHRLSGLLLWQRHHTSAISSRWCGGYGTGQAGRSPRIAVMSERSRLLAAIG